jgi:hypothetical protein
LSNLSVAIDNTRKLCPQAWSLVATKRYRNVGGFADYRRIYLEFADVLSFTRTKETPPQFLSSEWDSDSLAMMDAVAAKHISNRMPLFFVPQTLFEAADNSDITFTVDIDSLRLPFTGFSFILSQNPYQFSAIIVTKLHSNDVGVKFAHRTNPNNVCDSLLAIIGYRNYGEPALRAFLTNSYDPKGFHTRDDERIARQALIRVVFNLIYVMAARPEYVERGRRLGVHRKSQQEVWEPNIIGRTYATKHDPSAETGTHASPRMHMRRGHIRHQAYGVGLAEHKVIWIEPVLVNPIAKGAKA